MRAVRPSRLDGTARRLSMPKVWADPMLTPNPPSPSPDTPPEVREALNAADALAEKVLYLYEQRWDSDEEIAALEEPLDAFDAARRRARGVPDA